MIKMLYSESLRSSRVSIGDPRSILMKRNSSFNLVLAQCPDRTINCDLEGVETRIDLEPCETCPSCYGRNRGWCSEIREELGVRLRTVRVAGALRYDYPHRAVRFRIFRCRLVHGARPNPLSGSALRWVAPRGLRRLHFPPANRTLVAQLGGALPASPSRGKIPQTRRSREVRR